MDLFILGNRMTAHCTDCQPYLTDDELDDAQGLEDLIAPDHCIGCEFVEIKAGLAKEDNLLN
jgi:Pyruvate/2-oxoacid:ferredoxin oxidoreductase delta subunit